VTGRTLRPVERSFELAPNPGAPAAARAALGELRLALEPELLGRLRLVVSELVTNSVRHGPCTAPVTVRLRVDGPRRVRGEVVDGGDPKKAPSPRPRPPAGEDGGYGLQIVDRLAREWGVREGSTHVWFVLEA
jgi:anti-sigma regulatory factor (Ser/Thr protein kinase)